MPREYPSPTDTGRHPHPSPYRASSHPPSRPTTSSLPPATESSIPIPEFTPSLFPEQLVWDSDNEERLPERLQCVACHISIVVPFIQVGSDFPVLWRLAHCRHPLHLDCLAPLGRPYAIHPYYVHNPAATRIRRQRRHNPQFDFRPISRFEDAERMRTWLCPQEGCGQVQFSVLSHGDWYSNVHGMTIDGHLISGPTHS